MTRMRRSVKRLVFLSIGLAGLFAVQSTVAQSADELKAVLQIESAGQAAMEMEFFVDPERMRLDASEDVSVVWQGGADPKMMMIQHPQQQYMEIGGQQLQMMQQIQSQNPSAQAPPSALDPEQLTFETTSNTQQIGAWSAVEVLMTDADGQEGSLWFSTDVEVGLFELMARVDEATSVLQMPMPGGGMGAAQQLLQYQAVAQAQGLPDGRVVRIESQGSNAATMTLASVEPGPLPAGTFEAPDGYGQMQMPFAPGAPGQD